MWTKDQSKLAHIAATQVGWERPRYELVLRNVALVRPDRSGKVSALNASATNDGFERFMAFAEVSGFVDRQHPPGYWTAKAKDQCARIHRKISAMWSEGASYGLFDAAGLPGMIERVTTPARAMQGLPPTRILAEVGPTDSANLLEAVKAIFARGLGQRGFTTETQRHGGRTEPARRAS